MQNLKHSKHGSYFQSISRSVRIECVEVNLTLLKSLLYLNFYMWHSLVLGSSEHCPIKVKTLVKANAKIHNAILIINAVQTLPQLLTKSSL
jgi:hypothetical protein